MVEIVERPIEPDHDWPAEFTHRRVVLGTQPQQEVAGSNKRLGVLRHHVFSPVAARTIPAFFFLISYLKPLATAAVHSGRVIPEIDIWRAAQLMLKRYGEQALQESAARADELALAGDDDGAATWRRIMAAVTQLRNTTPRGPVH
jgi:hypothetical protein